MDSRLLILLVLPAICLGYKAMPTFSSGTDNYVMVHLFEWKWNDIAQECEDFLGPKGYGGIQVSPPQECVVKWAVDDANLDYDRPWWERYQVCSYVIEGRSGTEIEFQSMVDRCNNAGVKIYVDLVINHMTGNHNNPECTYGATYDYDNYDYFDVPYSIFDFNTHGCSIDYSDAWSVRECELLGMRDLTQADPYVQSKLAEYMNRLISYGVAGFRIDAAKHMWATDLEDVYGLLDDVSTTYFTAGQRPYIYQEVIADSAIPLSDYDWLARVTEFQYCTEIQQHFRGDKDLFGLLSLDESYGLAWRGDVIVFVDNHDNQRSHGGGGDVITHQEPWLYKMANGYHLAWDYGDRRIMSSYYFEHSDEGPPADSSGNIISPTFNADDSCNNGWVCEHRWRQIYNMVAFRNEVLGTSPENTWSNNANQIAFSRGNKGFIAINNDDWELNETLQTGLPAGTYCDVISGDFTDGSCTGKTITVDASGMANIVVPANGDGVNDGFVAIHLSKSL